MTHSSVRPRRLLGFAIQLLSVSAYIASNSLASKAELAGKTNRTSLSGNAEQSTLKAGTSKSALSGGASQTALTGGTSQTSLTGGTTQTTLTGGANQTALTGGASHSALTGGASQSVLTGGASQSALSGGATHPGLTGGIRITPLQGGIKDDASLNPSLRLLKPATSHGAPLSPGVGSTFLPGQVTQFSGHTSTGSLAPVLQPTQAQPGIYTRPQSGVIPPLSTYTLTRSNSRTWVAPGYEVTPANVSRSSDYVPPYSNSSATTSQHGVTTWVPGYDVNSISQMAAAGASSIIAGHGVGTGIAAYQPQFEVRKISVTSPPMTFDPGASTQKGVTSYAPGYEVSVISHNQGVVTWTPGYELSHVVSKAIKETTSGVWHSGAQIPPLLAKQALLPQPQFTKVLVGPPPMVANGLLLPQLRAQAVEKLTWDEWYKRVARAVYCRWQYAEVGPGSATVRMVVTKDRDISCQLIDFTPAPDIKRDVAAETLFRESAVKAVNMVTKFEIPDLPQPLDSDKVVFDIDLKRVVDGPVGVDIASNRK